MDAGDGDHATVSETLAVASARHRLIL